MGLIDLTTNLKSLKFGKDRIGAGSSNQPYIQRDIPDSFSDIGRTGGPDFLLRGGTLIPRRVANDVSRMTQMFFDFKSPNGILFAAKQNLLALSSTDFKAGEPLKLAQEKDELKGIKKFANKASVFLKNNINLNKDRVYTPLSTIAQVAAGPIGAHVYKQGLNPLEGPTKYTDYIKSLDEENGNNSRLVGLSRTVLTSNDINLFSYIGGPGANLGIGKTTIRKGESTDNGYTNIQVISDSKSILGKGDTSIIDFRKGYKSLDYKTKNIETRVNLGNPGKKGTGKLSNDYLYASEALDKINALEMYQNSVGNAHNTSVDNDLVKFRIGIINNDNPTNKTYIHFRAFIDSMSDSYSSQWNSDNFMGRAESFYRYNSFNRSVNLGWTVVAQSKAELMPMYRKLNFLASSLAPNYSNSGYMRGNLVTLTIGGWFYEQKGFITALTLEVPQESPWEIGIPTNEGTDIAADGSDVKSDKTVKELPHIVRVTGFQFTPIHDFTPQLQNNNYLGEKEGVKNLVSGFGNQRYIALSNGGANNNYDSQQQNLKPPTRVGSVEVGEGAFGGPFDQGNFQDIDQFNS